MSELSVGDLVFAIVVFMLLLMIILQTIVNRSVWTGYIIGLAAVLIAWLFCPGTEIQNVLLGR